MNYFPKNNRIALFSSYFLTDELPFYIKFYLEKLQPHVNDIIFITNEDKKLNEDSLNWLKTNTSHILFVKNEGYDFGMWQKALKKYSLDTYEELILCNDSCICFSEFDTYFDFHEKSSADVTGLTLSYEGKPHIQSYFITIKQRALIFVIDYIKKLDIINSNYKEVIIIGELGLSTTLNENKYKIEALFTPAIQDKKNPTFFQCIDLIECYNPLLKKRLLKEHDVNMMIYLWEKYGIYDLKKYIQKKYNYSNKISNSLFNKEIVQTINISEKIRFYRKLIKKYCKSFYKL